MLALAHHYDELLITPEGSYRARVYGQIHDDGMWAGRVVFFPVGGGRVIATGNETSQSSIADLRYWASGLSYAYLEGALQRALDLQPEAQLARELDRLERIEASADARAAVLEEAASLARTESRLAEAARERTEERLLGVVVETAELDAAEHERAAADARRQAQAADRARAAKTKARRNTRQKT